MINFLHCRKYFLVIIPLLLLGCSSKPELIEQKCSTCHKSSVVYEKKRTMVEWERQLYGMESRGLILSPEERKAILETLAKNYSLK
jgi:uncharacterized protein YcfL